jgi:uncharacterized protein YbjT (DUF2867 family)
MIVVFGGTGKMGRQIVDLLRIEGHPVRVITRVPDRIPLHLRAGIEIVRGDLLDRSSLTYALSSAEVVICTAHGGDGARANGPRGVERRGIPQLVEAARDIQLKHFLYVSTASASPDSPAEFFRLKAQAEARLRSSGIPYSILRPTHLLDTWVPMLAKPLATKSRAMIIGSGANPVSWVAGSDIASAATRLAGEPGQGFTADLGGPEALTLRQVNERLELALGVTAKRTAAMSRGMLRVAGSTLRPFNEVLSRQMQLGLLVDTRPQTVNSTSAWRQIGVTPTTVNQWIESRLPELQSESGLTDEAATASVARKDS